MKITFNKDTNKLYLDDEMRSMNNAIFVFNVMKGNFYINTNGHKPPVHNCVELKFDASTGEITDLGIVSMYELSRGERDTYFIKIDHPTFTTYIPSSC